MPLNADRIRALAACDDDDIPELTEKQAANIVRLLTASPAPTSPAPTRH